MVSKISYQMLGVLTKVLKALDFIFDTLKYLMYVMYVIAKIAIANEFQ